MILSDKEKLILKALIDFNGLSVKDISIKTKINERTIYRELKKLKNYLKKYNIFLIKNKSIYSLIDKFNVLNNISFNVNINEEIYYKEKRINLILCNILLKNIFTIKDLSNNFNLSYNTVFSSINSIDKILKKYNLTLIKKRGKGINICGTEFNKRILLIFILCYEFSNDEFFKILNNVNENENNNNNNNIFSEFINFEFLKKIYSNKKLLIFKYYSDTSIKKILIALNISIIRNNYFDLNININKQEKEFNYINEILLNIDKYNQYTVYFLIQILKTCSLSIKPLNFDYTQDLFYKVNFLVKNVSYKMNLNFILDFDLILGLIFHIKSAIKRILFNLEEENIDLLNFVKINYKEFYLVIEKELFYIFNNIKFNKTEISYIVIHFASSFEKLYNSSFINALVICNNSIGISKILINLIKKNIPEIKNIDYKNSINLKIDDKDKYDIIISNINLKKNISYIKISNILNKDDILKIRLYLKDYIKNKKILINNNLINNSCLNKINIILKNVFIVDSVKDKNYNLDDILNYIINSFISLKIYDKSLLIKHLKNKLSDIIVFRDIVFLSVSYNIDTPIIFIYYVNEIDSKKIINNFKNIKIFFFIISPNEEEYLKLLSSINFSLLNDITFYNSLKTKNIDFILTKLELILKNYTLNE